MAVPAMTLVMAEVAYCGTPLAQNSPVGVPVEALALLPIAV